MRIPLGKLVACIVLILALGALAWLLYASFGKLPPIDNGVVGPDFPRFTIDEEGSVTKDLPALSVTSLARIPSRQLKRLIFGIHPIVLETANAIVKDTERVVFRIDNKPSDILKEYEEYFTAIGWAYSASESSMGLVIRTATAQTTVDIVPQSPSGSLVAISQKQFP